MSTSRKSTRGNQGNGREERRQGASPYSRPSAPANQNTPSRLSGIINTLFSPFRSSNKSKAKDTILETDQVEVIEDIEITEDNVAAQDEDMATVYEREIYRTGGIELEGQAPPSPTPLSRGFEQQPPSALYLQDIGTSNSKQISRAPDRVIPSSPAFSFRTRDFESNRSRTPQAEEYRPMETSPIRAATESLALFFREKADAGNVPLNAIEEAGVLRLMQQAQLESLPTAFTPNFKSGGGASNSQSNLFSPSTTSNYAASTSGGSNAGTSSESGNSPYRRRRPLYVGAGYSAQSSRRRKQGTAIFGSNSTLGSDMRRSQSAGNISEMSGGIEEAGSSVAEGKKRRIDDAPDSGLPRSVSLGSLASPTSPVVAVVPSVTAVKAGSLAQKFAVATPVRPSPLWQVSKADTPSPSPPKKSTIPKAPTRAADIMMDIIRAEDAAQPKISREAVINPYESSDNPIARIPRSRPARAVTPRKTPVPVPIFAAAKSTPAKDISPLQLLERTMPAELRRDESPRIKVTPPVASSSSRLPIPASPVPPTKSSRIPVSLAGASKSISTPPPQAKIVPKKKAVEVIEILSSSDEEEEDEGEDEEEEAQTQKEIDEDEEEEEDDLDEIDEDEEVEDEQDEEMDDAEGEDDEESEQEETPPPPSKYPQDTGSRGSAVPASLPVAKAFTTNFKPSIEIKSTSLPTFAPSVSSSTAPSLFAPLSLPSLPTPVSAQIPSPFAFGIPSSSQLPSNKISDLEARRLALEKPKSTLPTFKFRDLLVETKKEEVGTLLKAFQDLAKEATKSELPTFIFS